MRRASFSRHWLPVVCVATLVAGCLHTARETSPDAGVAGVTHYDVAAGDGWRIDRLTARRFGARLVAPTNAAAFARAVEEAYRAMWRRWCATRVSGSG